LGNAKREIELNISKRSISIALASIIAVSLVSAAVSNVLYARYGRRIVKSCVESKASVKDVHPPEYYYHKIDKRFSRITSYVVASSIAFLCVLLIMNGKLYVIMSVLLPLLMIECLIAMMLAFPSMPRFGMDDLIDRIYLGSYRNIIQFEPGNARYDSELTYTLKPGTSFFSNPEFKNRYMVNSLGFRDDERSLLSPEIIVLGDSYAMGWGIDQDDMYSSLVEKEKGLLTLNTAVASYGTVREMRTLDRVDTSKLKYLVMHYLFNDYEENKAFYENKNSLNITSEDKYNEVVREHLKTKRYYPGKYVKLAYKNMKEGFKSPKTFKKAVPFQESAGGAGYFINAIMNGSRKDLTGVKVIVLGDKAFLASLKETISSGDYPGYIKSIEAIDWQDKMTRDCFYDLDDHINAKGHRILAEEVSKRIK